MRKKSLSRTIAAILIVTLVLVGVPESRADGPETTGTLTAQSVTIAHSVAVPGQNQYATETELNYWLYLPEADDRDADELWPLVLFLHGRGERGDDLEVLKQYGPPMMIEDGADFPFILAAPLCSADFYWPEVPDLLMGLIEHLQTNHAIDPDRIIFTGLSMGGAGTWALASTYPEVPAAIVPIASFYPDPQSGMIGAVPENICHLAEVPAWVLHGDADDAMPLYNGQVIVEALEACGGDVRFTILVGADHAASWERAYADPELFAWMMEQRREVPPED
ncbi:MAG: phospholipase [Chloroflexi bacterium]|nr:phospholipase [Chloroflexota bacterium]